MNPQPHRRRNAELTAGEQAPWEDATWLRKPKPKSQKARKKQFKKKKLKEQPITTLDDLRKFLKIAPDQWDAIVVSDGSGTSWGSEMGYASVLIRNNSFSRDVFYGGNSTGTNNVAEMQGVFWPLFYLVNNQQAGLASNGCRVHVITDSQYVRDGLLVKDAVNDYTLRSNRELWIAMHAFKRRGILIFPHHIYRDTIDLNRLCHDVANLARKQQKNLLQESGWNPYDANPQH